METAPTHKDRPKHQDKPHKQSQSRYKQETKTLNETPESSNKYSILEKMELEESP